MRGSSAQILRLCDLCHAAIVSFRYRAGRGTMAKHDLTEREDRFVGLCLAAAAIVVVFIYIVSYS